MKDKYEKFIDNKSNPKNVPAGLTLFLHFRHRMTSCWLFYLLISSTKSSSFPLKNTVDPSTIVKFAIRLGSIYFASLADIFTTFFGI